ncbi:DUF3800 domain-containing protein [Roseobacter fucihabitans]|uniref:DUF3800 domain-containing protein n=1 Tax=Roseobacter fucihabitans TaxID=1537242 RepID=UPI0030CCCCC8
MYIDEAGDDGLSRIKPVDSNGASEWLCIGGFLTRANYEAKTVQWVKEMRRHISALQGPALHYRKLSPSKKDAACSFLADLPVKAFVVCSHKVNMRGHQSSSAAIRGGKQWFYNYCVRLLMERATEMCLKDSLKHYKEPRPLKVVFSARGGHSYGQTKAYWEILKRQAAGGTTVLNKREIRHQVLRFNLIDYLPHQQNAGLQIADIIASAFYQSVETSTLKWEPRHAKMLQPIMAKERNVVADFGLALQPTNPRDINLTEDQKAIFRYYGYTAL